MANLDELKKTVEDKQTAFDKAALELSDAKDAHVAAKVAAMDPGVVEEAKKWEINPENFEDTTHLQGAIEIASKTRTQANPVEDKAPLDPNLVVEATGLGLNPADYDSDDHIQNAIYKAQKAKEAETNVKPGAASSGDVAPAK